MATQFMGKVVDHDPLAEKDYTIDWTDWLAGDGVGPADNISTATWVIAPITDPPLEKFNQANNTKASTAWFRGGKLGTLYYLTCHVESVGGRKDQRSIAIRSKDT